MNQEKSSEEGFLVTPRNFSLVESGIYRSAQPNSHNIPFLKTLKLKAIVNLTSNGISDDMKEFYESAGIKLLCFDLGRGNRKHNIHADEHASSKALNALLDHGNHPVLIHCKKGKHRTGCVIGLLRKNRNWALSNIFAEYCSFEPLDKNREEDQRFIEAFGSDSAIEFMMDE